MRFAALLCGLAVAASVVHGNKGKMRCVCKMKGHGTGLGYDLKKQAKAANEMREMLGICRDGYCYGYSCQKNEITYRGRRGNFQGKSTERTCNDFDLQVTQKCSTTKWSANLSYGSVVTKRACRCSRYDDCNK